MKVYDQLTSALIRLAENKQKDSRKYEVGEVSLYLVKKIIMISENQNNMGRERVKIILHN